jgi:hypothetical protein
MQMNGDDIKVAVQELTIALREKHEYAYITGYMESFYTRLLTAYVPANRRFDMLELFAAHVKSIREE